MQPSMHAQTARLAHCVAFCIASLMAVTGRGTAQSRSQTVTLVIRGVAVLPMDRDTLLRDRDVMLTGNGISAIVRTGGAIPAGSTVVDGRGHYLIPGLWDAHVHALEKPEATFELLLRHGVTAVRDMGSDVASLLAARQAVAERQLVAPRIWAAGPLLDGPRQRWSQRGAWHLTELDSVPFALDSLARLRVDFLKVYNTLSATVYQALASAARARGLSIAGHVPFSITATEAVRAGQRSLEHAGLDVTSLDCIADGGSRFRALLGVWSSQGYGAYLDGVARLREERDPACVRGLLSLYRDAGTWVTPTMVNTIKDSATVNWGALALADSAARAACVGTVNSFHAASEAQRARHHREFREDVVALQRAGVRLAAGTDFPNACLVPGASLHDELAWLVEAGLTPYEALRSATYQAAALVGASDSIGTIRPGMLADLVLLGENPRANIGATRTILKVIRNGVPLFTK